MFNILIAIPLLSLVNCY